MEGVEYPKSGEKSSVDFIQKGLGGSATSTAVANSCCPVV